MVMTAHKGDREGHTVPAGKGITKRGEKNII
jgi:hypothetical protein